MNFTEYLGKQIKGVREQRGFKQYQLADLVGIPHQSLSRYELGRISPNAQILRRLARALSVSVDVLVGTWDEMIEDDPP